MSVRTQKVIDAARNIIVDEPSISICRLVSQLDINWSTAAKIIRIDIGLFPYFIIHPNYGYLIAMGLCQWDIGSHRHQSTGSQEDMVLRWSPFLVVRSGELTELLFLGILKPWISQCKIIHKRYRGHTHSGSFKAQKSKFWNRKITFVTGKNKFCSKRNLFGTEKIKFCSRKSTFVAGKTKFCS